MIAPQCPNGGFWNINHLLQLIRSTIKEHNIDEDRVYLTGLSMGGYGSWALAATAPEMFAAVAPICGGGDPQTASKLKDLPIWVFHGDADRVVPISGSPKMVDAIKDAGGEKVKFTIYQGVGHNSWTATYENELLHEWFLKNKREQSPGGLPFLATDQVHSNEQLGTHNFCLQLHAASIDLTATAPAPLHA